MGKDQEDLENICETSYKMTGSMTDKVKRGQKPANIIMSLLGILGVLLLLISVFIENHEIERLLTWTGFGSVWAAIIFKLFIVKSGFGYKPTREEIEEKQFGGEN
jgi:protein-S-isoprenylcysteine O-methyltransferase Ste14